MLTVNIREKDGGDRRLVFGTQEVIIGRAKGSDILLPKSNVSKRHARITEKDEKVVLVDLRSTNGTYVNGRRITAAEEIGPDDKVYVGDFVLKVASVRNPEYQATAPHEPVPKTQAMDATPLDVKDEDGDDAADDELGRTEDLDPALLNAMSDLEEPEEGLLDDDFGDEPSISPEDIFDEDIAGSDPLAIDPEALGMDPDEAREVGLAPTRHSTGEREPAEEEPVDDAAQIVASTAAFDVLADPDAVDEDDVDDEELEPTGHLDVEDLDLDSADSTPEETTREEGSDDDAAPGAEGATDKPEVEEVNTGLAEAEEEATAEMASEAPEPAEEETSSDEDIAEAAAEAVEDIVFFDELDEDSEGDAAAPVNKANEASEAQDPTQSIDKLLADASIHELLFVGTSTLEITQGGTTQRFNSPLSTAEEVEELVNVLLDEAELDDLGPVVVDTVLSDGRALTVVPRPIAPQGPVVRIERPSTQPIDIEAMHTRGAITSEQLEAIRGALNRREKILVVGPDASQRHAFCATLLTLIEGSNRVVCYGGLGLSLEQTAHVIALDRTALGEAGEALSDTVVALEPSCVLMDTLTQDDLGEWVSIALSGQTGLIGSLAGREGEATIARAALALDLSFGGSLGEKASALMRASVDHLICLKEGEDGSFVVELSSI